MIPTIKQVMKCYRVIAQIERMKTGRPGVETAANALRGAVNVCRAAGIELTAPVADTQGRTQSATGGGPSRLEKAGRSRICLSDNGKILKADWGFGLDHSKSSDALLLRCSDAQMPFCSDAQMPRSVKTAPAVLTDRVPFSRVNA